MAEESDQAEVNQPAFWEAAYQEGRYGWDLGQPAPPFLDLLTSDTAPPPGRLLVLGSGYGHDALLFAHFGFEVTGVDFAPSAVAGARAMAEQAQLPATFVEADLFTLGERWPGRFDYVVEHTCFCAIDPSSRPAYVEVVRDVLRPGGELIALFYVHRRGGGPPYATTEEEVRVLFEPYFVIESLALAPNSIERRQGEELFGRLRRVSVLSTEY
jgi:SAM-dependent methyltransferase